MFTLGAMVGLRCFTQHQTSSFWELLGSAQVGNTWRTTGDVKGSWPAIMDNLDGTVGLGRYARPGAWNDADLLEVWCLGLCYIPALARVWRTACNYFTVFV